jgi:ADP-dependent phosphofructokinase/glucokinase
VREAQARILTMGYKGHFSDIPGLEHITSREVGNFAEERIKGWLEQPNRSLWAAFDIVASLLLVILGKPAELITLVIVKSEFFDRFESDG